MNNSISELTTILKEHPFAIFNLPLKFSIDQNSLSEKYQELQKKYHPDNFASINNETKFLAMKVSAHINQAYTILKSALSRSLALLEINGIRLDLAQDTALPEQFLIQQMELHEEIEEAEQSIVHLEKIEINLNSKISNLEINIEQAFNNNNFAQVTELTKQLAFYTKVANSVMDKINSLY